jgi:ABC-type transporter Mla MlaB component
MTKEDQGNGLFSKVVRFVRHPTVEWSEIDRRPTGVDEEREALKAALQRKRRNDKVRQNELNELRVVLRQRQAEQAQRSPAAATDSGQTQASVQTPGGPEADKSRTIEQIARIEEQMSQHWTHRRATEGDGAGSGLRVGGGAQITGRLDGGMTVPAHLSARAPDAPAFAMDIDVVTEDPLSSEAAWEAALVHPSMVEAAVRHANGEVDAAEHGLQALMAQELFTPTARMAGLALLDLHYARADLAGFEEYAAEFSERFSVPVPRWPAVKPLAEAGVQAPQPNAATHGDRVVWACPLFLDAAAVAELGQLVAASRGTRWLDWTELVAADQPAATALQTLVEQWLQAPGEFRFLGGAVLRRRLKASTPSGRRENDPIWWLLRLALLRLMRRREEFDLAALDYCVTYGVLPPDWVEPTCRFELADAVPAEAEALEPTPQAAELQDAIQTLDAQVTGMETVEWPSMATTLPGQQTRFPEASTSQAGPWPSTLPDNAPTQATLRGEWVGNMATALAELDAALQSHPADQAFRIDCRALHRVDFAAAGVLVQWLQATTARGFAVEFCAVSRLVATFFHVVGIDEAVTVRLRQY